MTSIEKQLKAAKKIVEQGGCMGVSCKNCPSSRHNSDNSKLCCNNVFYSGRAFSLAHLQAFKDFNAKYDHPEFGERIQVRNSDTYEWTERTFLFTHKGRFYCVDNMSASKFEEAKSICAIAWKHWRKIPAEPEIEITVKINGKKAKLSDISEETLLKIHGIED